MARSIIIIVLVLFIAHALALMGLLGYGALTGRFAPELREQYLATWRGEKLVPPVVEEVVEEEEEGPRDAQARIQAAAIESEMLTREQQMLMQTLDNMMNTVSIVQADLQKSRAKLAVAEDEFQRQLDAQQQRAQDEGFRKALDNYSRMNPKYVKDDFMQMSDDEAVRYLAAMKPTVATSILERFREPHEQQKRLRLMKLLEQQGQIDPDQEPQTQAAAR